MATLAGNNLSNLSDRNMLQQYILRNNKTILIRQFHCNNNHIHKIYIYMYMYNYVIVEVIHLSK